MGLFKGFNKKNKKEELIKGLDMNIISDDLVDSFINVHEKEIEESGKINPGRCFELFLEEVFRLAGYCIEDRHPNGNKNDGGIDFVAEKDGIFFAVQAKKRKIDATTLLSVNEVRNLIGAIDLELNKGRYLKGVFITTHYFSEEAKKEARAGDIELIDKEGLVLLISKIQPMLLAKAYYSRMTEDLPRCPKCGKFLIKRKKYSKYWAHPNYPHGDCDYRKSIK